MCLLAVMALNCHADVKLPSILGPNMVLQQGRNAPIWGTAAQGEQITVTFAGQSKTATVGPDGKWKVLLDPLAASSNGRTLTVSGSNVIELQNVVVGEVWVCSGQSNMWFPLKSAEGGSAAIAGADNPQIRLFTVAQIASPEIREDCEGKWDLCNPKTAGGFSAVAYFFAQELGKIMDVPVGLVGDYWGGKGIEAFTPRKSMEPTPWGPGVLARLDRAIKTYDPQAAQKKYDMALATWEQANAAFVEEKKQGKTTGVVPGKPAMPVPPGVSGEPTTIYNGMIAPIVSLAIRGVIWYQGEANHDDGMLYLDKMKTLIGGWREAWNQGEFPFYYVQLSPCKMYSEKTLAAAVWPPVDPPSAEIKGTHRLPLVWQAQLESLKIPNTGMVVIVDVGNPTNLHPIKKLEVGKRLALWALAKTYGKTNLVYSGPLYKSLSVEDGKIRLQFDYAGGGLATRDGKDLDWFEIAGADKVFYPGQAVINDKTVVVSSDQVKMPQFVRYGWHEMAQPNLMNKEGLPASPFTTEAVQ